MIDWNDIVEVHADGGLLSRNPSEIGGSWAWCALNFDGEIVYEESGHFFWPGKLTTNNHTEQVALLKALIAIPKDWKGLIGSDSQCAVGRQFSSNSRNNLPPNLCQLIDDMVTKFRLWDRKHGLKTVLFAGHPNKKELAGEFGRYEVEFESMRGKIVRSYGLEKPQPGEDQLPVCEGNKRCDDLCKKEKDKAKEILNNGKERSETKPEQHTAEVN